MLRIINIRDLRLFPKRSPLIQIAKKALEVIKPIIHWIKLFLHSYLKNRIKYFLIFLGKSKKIYPFDTESLIFDNPKIIKKKAVHLVGGSSVYIENGKAFFTENADISRDRFAEEYRGFFKFGSLGLDVISYEHGAEVYGPTLNLMSGVGLNYAHWLSECLPRLELFINECEHDLPRALNILVNQGIADTMVEAIGTLIEGLFDALIIMVPDAELVYVSDLYLSVGVGYCQFEPRNNNLKQYCYFNEKLLLGISSRVINNIGSTSCSSKLYLERSSQHRVPMNQGGVVNLLKDAGFKIFSPEKFSFREQVRNIAGAECVVSPTGASLANCMFARRGCDVFILMNDSSHSFLEYWTKFLSFNTSNISYVLCKGLNQDPHSSYVVDLENLSQLLIKKHAS